MRQEGEPAKRIAVTPHNRLSAEACLTPNGNTYRPSMFVTLTLDSYSKVYDYQRVTRSHHVRAGRQAGARRWA